MSNEGHVMALLAEGNPAPELDDDSRIDLDARTYLATLEQRSRKMTVSETKEIREETSRRPYTPWLVAAIVVLVIGVAVVVFNQMNPAPVVEAPESIPLEGAEEHPGAAEEFSAVEAGYAAWNNGDPAWIEIRMAGTGYVIPEEEEEERSAWLGWFPTLMTAEPHVDVTGCVAQGSGEWWGLDEGGAPATGHLFVCEATETDALLRLAGVSAGVIDRWVVDDGVVVVKASGDGGAPDVDDFYDAFVEWLGVAHPEAAGELIPQLENDWFEFAESRSQILDFAEEFVMQSDVYPLENPDL